MTADDILNSPIVDDLDDLPDSGFDIPQQVIRQILDDIAELLNDG